MPEPPDIAKTAASLRDLLELADYLGRTSLGLAERFLDAAEATCERLARRPGIGSLWEDDDPKVRGIRLASIDGFKNHLVFYRETDGGIRVLRVLHAARDLRGLIHSDEGADEVLPPTDG